jgi:hypothetical protein
MSSQTIKKPRRTKAESKALRHARRLASGPFGSWVGRVSRQLGLRTS